MKTSGSQCGTTFRYAASLDLANLDDARARAVAAIAPGSRVLDLGCATGRVAEALVARGCKVWGVEIDAAAAEIARRHCEGIVVGDLEVVDLGQSFPGRVFDAVLLLDVLEHLREPAELLGRCAAVLEPGGFVLASIPNVAHGAVRLQLLSGRFRYTETGLLDRSHLRFFDCRSAVELFERSGYAIEEVIRIERALEEADIDLDLTQYPDALIQQLRQDPDAKTYQYLIRAIPGIGVEHRKRPDDASVGSASGRPAVEAEESELDRLAADQRALARDLESLRRSRDAALEDVVQRVKSFEGVLRGLVVERDQLAARIAAMEKAFPDLWQSLERGAERADEAARRLEQEMNELARRGSQRIDEMLDLVRHDLSEQRALTEEARTFVRNVRKTLLFRIQRRIAALLGV